MKTTLAIALLLAGVVCAQETPKLIEVSRIWDAAPHNAFTDLIRFNDTWYCTFREGSAHIPGTDGKIRIIRSSDGKKWESAALLAEKTIDLRDPKISQMPDGRLMIVMGGSVYDGQEPTPNRKRTGAWSRVSFSSDGTTWSEPKKVEGVGEGSWLWRVTWHKGSGYGAVYSVGGPGGKRTMSVWTTKDGVKYEKLCEPAPDTNLSEYTIRFLADDTMVILLRGEDKVRKAWVGTSKAPYNQWQWTPSDAWAGGPNFIVLASGKMVYGGRDYKDKKAVTMFGVMDSKSVTPLLTLPSGGDNSYPGFVEAKPGEVWMSYYSGHEGKTSIYLAKIRIEASSGKRED